MSTLNPFDPFQLRAEILADYEIPNSLVESFHSRSKLPCGKERQCKLMPLDCTDVRWRERMGEEMKEKSNGELSLKI
jgi:hypothetical protein